MHVTKRPLSSDKEGATFFSQERKLTRSVFANIISSPTTIAHLNRPASSHQHEKLLEQALGVLSHFEILFSFTHSFQRAAFAFNGSRCPTDMEADLVEVPTGTITAAILKAAETTPVAIPMGMTTYGLDIVVKFDAVRYLLWQSRSAPAHFRATARHPPRKATTIPHFFPLSFSSRVCTDYVKDTVAAVAMVDKAATPMEEGTLTDSLDTLMEAEDLAEAREETVCLTLVPV
jgi:hypothetical protein